MDLDLMLPQNSDNLGLRDKDKLGFINSSVKVPTIGTFEHEK